ncbi:hypothetical protein B0A54_01883 [Friedmanniomyces endolithicus]|uniref:Uncharacterized protein n=1 Tax=Friedmanniomyces endolithicus TaxID=329885 RepID=A0A4U0VEJ3_9PEZI|nr:hypothetical protein LTS09_005188 [Friedmanniomyces endolithicus]KAK0308892.1 hypothetical protein LTR01_004772 [Friedmanniomyces endolithicus]KAK0829905.1 hypothetical protein LTR73_004042 [Friedmanniomyces endolithicus]TKA47511.1 hypothetical protein B0A54_01883 [Friedmanniomyces endolithicus]
MTLITTDSRPPPLPPPTVPLPTPSTTGPLPATDDEIAPEPPLPPPPFATVAATSPLEAPHDFDTLSQAVSTNLEHLAAWHEESGKPYARRKAGMLRRGERRARELVGELAGLQRVGDEVEEDQEVDWMGVAERLEAYSREGVGGDGNGEVGREEVEAQSVEDRTEETGIHVPTPPPSDNNEQRTPVKNAAVQTPVVSLPDPHWATLAAHDIATVSRIDVAANMLRLTLPDVADAVEAFGVRVCGQRAWADRVGYYEGWEIGGSVDDARALLEGVSGMLGVGDGGELGGIIGLL